MNSRALPRRQQATDLEAVYEGLDSSEAACRYAWPALGDAIAKVADALRDDPAFRPSGCALTLDEGL